MKVRITFELTDRQRWAISGHQSLKEARAKHADVDSWLRQVVDAALEDVVEEQEVHRDGATGGP